jgi:hypothetical protein
MSEPKSSETAPKKMVRRSVAITFGIGCIILMGGLVGAFAYYHYTPIISGNENTISSLNAEISQLNSTLLSLQEQVGADNLTIQSLTNQIVNLQNILNGLTNGTGIPLDIIVNNSSAWVNKTVLVQGTLSVINLMVLGGAPPWDYLLVSSNGIDRIGVYWWKDELPEVSQVQIYGVVRQGIWTNQFSGNTTVFYIEALTIDPIVF